MSGSDWKILITDRAARELHRLQRADASRVLAALNRVAGLDEPERSCKVLSGPLTGLWRLRVGGFRLVLDIRRSEVVIVAVDVADPAIKADSEERY